MRRSKAMARTAIALSGTVHNRRWGTGEILAIVESLGGTVYPFDMEKYNQHPHCAALKEEGAVITASKAPAPKELLRAVGFNTNGKISVTRQGQQGHSLLWPSQLSVNGRAYTDDNGR